MRKGIFVTIFVALSCWAVGQPVDLDVVWDGGLSLKDTADRIEIGFGGVLMLDGGRNFIYRNEGTQDLSESSELFIRRARLNIGATFFQRAEAFLEMGFADNKISLKDAYLAFSDALVLDQVILGHIKEPIGLDELTSSKRTMLIERDITSEFAPSRNLGILLNKHSVNYEFSLWAGAFAEADNTGRVKEVDENYSLSGRLVYLPVYQKEESKVVHIGAAYSFRRNFDPDYSFDIQPETKISSLMWSSPLVNVNNIQLQGLEFIASNGRWNFQGEGMLLRAAEQDVATFAAKASFFLFGKRQYAISNSTLSKIAVDRPIFREGGNPGAIEFVAQVSAGHILNDNGDDIQTFTPGINWFMNRNIRFSAAYHHIITPNVDEGILQFRMQFYL